MFTSVPGFEPQPNLDFLSGRGSAIHPRRADFAQRPQDVQLVLDEEQICCSPAGVEVLLGHQTNTTQTTNK